MTLMSNRICVVCGLRPSVDRSHVVPAAICLDARCNDKTLLALGQNFEEVGDQVQSGYHEPLLCTECEGDFGKKFDMPAVRFLRRLRHTLPSALRKADGSVKLDFPRGFREFIFSVIYRANHCQEDSGWAICSDLWDSGRLLDIIQGRSSDDLELYARVIVLDDPRYNHAYIVPPVRTAPDIGYDDERFPFTCMAFGGMEFIARMPSLLYPFTIGFFGSKSDRFRIHLKVKPNVPQIPKDGGSIAVPLGTIFQNWTWIGNNTRHRQRFAEETGLGFTLRYLEIFRLDSPIGGPPTIVLPLPKSVPPGKHLK